MLSTDNLKHIFNSNPMTSALHSYAVVHSTGCSFWKLDLYFNFSRILTLIWVQIVVMARANVPSQNKQTNGYDCISDNWTAISLLLYVSRHTGYEQFKNHRGLQALMRRYQWRTNCKYATCRCRPLCVVYFSAKNHAISGQFSVSIFDLLLIQG